MDISQLDYDLVQWPAMVFTVVASWLVASDQRRKRGWGFGVFILSNVTWVVWALFAHAPALLLLQICLCAMNIRGAFKAEKSAKSEST